MYRFLQTHFQACVGLDTMLAVRDIYADGVRSDAQTKSAEEVQLIAGEGQEIFGLDRAVVTVYRPEEIQLLPPGTHIEVGNEPDINLAPLHNPSPEDYAALVVAMYDEAQRLGLHTWAGVVSNLNDRGIAYLRKCVPLFPTGVNITVHRYPHDEPLRDGPTIPHKGFNSREHEVAVLRDIIGPDRKFAVSEFGYHTSPRQQLKSPLSGRVLYEMRWTNEDNKANVAWEWAFWDRMGAEFAVLFQINDGPEGSEDTSENTYGARFHTGEWKPLAKTFAENR